MSPDKIGALLMMVSVTCRKRTVVRSAYIDYLFLEFPNAFFRSFSYRLCPVCEHKCGWLAMEICKLVEISYSQKFPLQNGHAISWNTVLILFVRKRLRGSFIISTEMTAICRVTLASMSLLDMHMHVVEVQVPFLSRHSRTPVLLFCSVPPNFGMFWYAWLVTHSDSFCGDLLLF